MAAKHNLSKKLHEVTNKTNLPPWLRGAQTGQHVGQHFRPTFRPTCWYGLRWRIFFKKQVANMTTTKKDVVLQENGFEEETAKGCIQT